MTDVVHDAVMEHLAKEPQVLSVPRGLLVHRLYQAAWRDMANLLRSERRRSDREQRYASEAEWVVSPGTDYPPKADAQRPALLALATGETERICLELWLDGAGTEQLADALGWAHASPEDRRREVRRFKDRILMRGRRKWGSRGGR